MVKETAIQFEHAAVGYHHRRGTEVILSGLNLSLSRGELVGAVGLNGSGKSTLLRTIAGLLPLIDGNIRLENRSLKDYDTVGLARKISVVLTERVGGFNLTVEDLVATGQMPYTDTFHRVREQHQQVIDAAIARSGVASYRLKNVSQLSDGMFQKAMIARSLAQQTAVMLLDEPTAFLDYASRHGLFQLLKQLCVEENKCVMVTSHDLDLLVKYCHKILIIHGGSASLCEVPDALKDPRFMEITGGYL